MTRETEIINRLKVLGLEMSKQDNRSTCTPIWCDYKPNKKGLIKLGCYSFFETDVFEDNNYVASNYEAPKMKELQKLLIELSTFNKEKQEFTTERTETPEEYVKKLLLDTKQAGKMKPDLTLKIIISNVMEKFKLDTEQSMSLIHKVLEEK